MASGHTSSMGTAEGVTVPGGTPRSEVSGAPRTDPEQRDLLGPGAQPPAGTRSGPPDPVTGGEELAYDKDIRLARSREPGQQLAAGEG